MVYKQFCLKPVQCFKSGISWRRLSCGRQKQGQPLGSLVGSRGRRKVGVVRAPTERRLFKFSIFGFESLLQKSVLPNSSLPVTPWVSLNHICLTEWQSNLLLQPAQHSSPCWESGSCTQWCLVQHQQLPAKCWSEIHFIRGWQGMAREHSLNSGQQAELMTLAVLRVKPTCTASFQRGVGWKKPKHCIQAPHSWDFVNVKINQTNKVMCYSRLACQY